MTLFPHVCFQIIMNIMMAVTFLWGVTHCWQHMMQVDSDEYFNAHNVTNLLLAGFSIWSHIVWIQAEVLVKCLTEFVLYLEHEA